MRMLARAGLPTRAAISETAGWASLIAKTLRAKHFAHEENIGRQGGAHQRRQFGIYRSDKGSNARRRPLLNRRNSNCLPSECLAMNISIVPSTSAAERMPEACDHLVAAPTRRLTRLAKPLT